MCTDSLSRLPARTPWSSPSEHMQSADGRFFQDLFLSSGGGLCRHPCFGPETSGDHSDSRTSWSAGRLSAPVPRRMHSSVSADRKDAPASAPLCGPSQSQMSGALWSITRTRLCEPERRPYSDSFAESGATSPPTRRAISSGEPPRTSLTPCLTKDISLEGDASWTVRLRRRMRLPWNLRMLRCKTRCPAAMVSATTAAIPR
mmetsp:Transcript_67592/g.213886  ORF Transcript_67592/g.213886 Transcript_67592/m.213886 type:complete len:202 (+) Transcript_67592:511-1116(+)